MNGEKISSFQNNTYTCIKLPITKILHNNNKENENILSTIQDTVFRTNHIITLGYMLLRFWVLEKYHTNQQIPKIDENTIKMSFKTFYLKDKMCTNEENKNMLMEFKTLIEKNKLTSLQESKIDETNLLQILSYSAIKMLTAIENNIKMHFIDRVKTFIYRSFYHNYKTEIEKTPTYKKELRKELTLVIKDILENHSEDLESDEKYHTWIRSYKYKILPENYEESYYYDIHKEPQKYLKHMIFMCLELEEKQLKLFQFFPLQTRIIPNHIDLDTYTINRMFETNKKLQRERQSNLTLNEVFIWDKFFNINNKYDTKKYSFNNVIVTDGYSVSLRMITKEQKEKMKTKQSHKKNCREENKKLTKEEKVEKKKKKQLKDQEEKETIKKEQTRIKEALKIQIQNETKEEKATRKKIEKEQKEILKQEKQEEKRNNSEFKYIDEVPKEELKGNRVFIDPGKRSLLYMMDEKETFLDYTTKGRFFRTKRFKYQRLLQNYKNKFEIQEVEKELTGLNSKSCVVNCFQEYIHKKIEINKKLSSFYQQEIFRKYKWYLYLNNKKENTKLIEEIKKNMENLLC